MHRPLNSQGFTMNPNSHVWAVAEVFITWFSAILDTSGFIKKMLIKAYSQRRVTE